MENWLEEKAPSLVQTPHLQGLKFYLYSSRIQGTRNSLQATSRQSDRRRLGESTESLVKIKGTNAEANLQDNIGDAFIRLILQV